MNKRTIIRKKDEAVLKKVSLISSFTGISYSYSNTSPAFLNLLTDLIKSANLSGVI